MTTGLRKHIDIAFLALARGYIDAGCFAEIVRRLRQALEAQGSLDDVWWQRGLLPPAQRDRVLALVTQETRQPPQPPQPPEPGRGPADARDGGAAAGPLSTVIERLRGAARELEPDSTGIFDDIDEGSCEDGGEDRAEQPGEEPLARLRYQHEHVIGSGGLGTVTSCYDTLLGRRVAVKTPRPDQGRHAQSVIEREARIVAGLEHPNIIPVYDAGYLPGVGPFYVMRALSQPSLGQVLRRLEAGEPEALKTYTLRRLLRFFVQICQAVDYAHDRGVLHCDLKPANVLLGNFGECLVVDWGLAYSPDAPSGPQGGTPGFVAPEQFAGRDLAFDPRVDVFSLGAILYMMLCLQPPFPELSSQASQDSQASKDRTASGARRAALLARYEKPPVPPGQVAAHAAQAGRMGPAREVPAELEEVCLRALALDPADRPASAAALALAVDEYLEGKRELERRRSEADSYVACGDELAERCREFVEGRPEQMDSLAALRASTPPWAPAADKLEIWNMEDMISVTEALQVRTFQAAMAAYEQALELLPQHEGARRGMAALYRDSLARARRERGFAPDVQLAHRIYLLEDGRYLEETRSDGHLRVVLPARARAALWTLREDGRRLVRGQALDVDWAAPRVSLPAGSYVLEVWEGAGARVRYPVRIDAGRDVEVAVDPGAAQGLADDEVLIPGGPALLGASEPMADVRQAGEVDVDTFAMQRWPVRFGQYLAFLDDLDRARPGGEAVAAHLPRDSAGVPLVRRQKSGQDAGQESAWVPASMGEDIPAEMLPALPVFGVSVPSAEAYAAWLSARTGRAYRLPRDSEWEKVARGTDGRAYPWGDHFDPTFCKMRSSRAGVSQPEPPGAFAADESPYGVRDMAGGVADWTLPDPGEPVFGAARREPAQRLVYSRGGAWCDWPMDCRVSVRRAYWACERSRRVGFRLARSL